MMSKLYLGLDVGSTSACTVILDEKINILYEDYRRTYGQPLRTVANILEEIIQKFSLTDIVSLSFTGSGGKTFLSLLGGEFINEIIAHGKAVAFYYPEVRTVIEIGGEDSKLIFLAPDETGRPRIVDFAMNTLCAAGTGAFLDQQAHRLGLKIEEFSCLALKAKTIPRIAGRCAVFAKSDMIHLQQEGTPLPEIVAGLCYALARNLRSNIGRGKPFHKPVAFQGGVAANLGMRRAFCDILRLKPEELIIPKHYLTMGAIGAALDAIERKKEDYHFPGLEKLYAAIKQEREIKYFYPPLKLEKSCIKKTETYIISQEKIPAYLGVDVGSVSTNLVLIDEKGQLLAKEYLMTAGHPLEAVKKGLKSLGKRWKDKVEILGAATTGSGRFLVGDFIGADVIKNEITAQATAAVAIDPKVDTIIEIGGQDSKFIRLENGAIIDFEMNKACAAGTGSFLEEQADSLSISIYKEFSDLALSAKHPAPLGERCTVFMKSDLVHYQQKGLPKEDLVAGLCYAIAYNFINKVVSNRTIGDHIFFQGGVAANKGVVAAFEQILKKPIIVPPHHEVTGAIGAALLAKKEKNWEKSKFKGFDLAHLNYQINTFVCKACPNQCEIKKVTIEGQKEVYYYGGRCEKYEIAHRDISPAPDLVKEREKLLLEYVEKAKEGDRGEIAIPYAFFLQDFLPFFATLLNELGFKVVVSAPTTKETIQAGVESVLAETCYPVKVAHGHVSVLIKSGYKRLFFPNVIDLPSRSPGFVWGMVCPYVQGLPYMLKSAFNFEKEDIEFLHPVVYLGRTGWYYRQSIKNLSEALRISKKKVEKAWEKAKIAQKEFEEEIVKKAKKIISNLSPKDIAIVIVGRAYNSFDSGTNLRIPQKLSQRGVPVIPLDALPLETVRIKDAWPHMYWRYGQHILTAAAYIRDHPQLYPIYITNFACGPDSFILHFFKEEIGKKPFLEIEIDEHSADAGVITRLEAFLDSIKGKKQTSKAQRRYFIYKKHYHDACVYIPYMCDHSYALAAVFEGCGVKAKVMSRTDEESFILGRQAVSGKECYPCLLTAGDMLKTLKQPDFDPKYAAFFMPTGSGPCRFGQYAHFHRRVLDEWGYTEIPIFSPNQDGEYYEKLGMVANDFILWAWRGLVAVDILEKFLRHTRPYEKKPGEADKIYQNYLEKICEYLRQKEEPLPLLIQAANDFEKIRDNAISKPTVGIVGEIYLRSNPFANENLIRRLEALGAEVWLPPLGEWIFYTNHTAILRSWRQRYLKRLLRLLITTIIQHKEEWRFVKKVASKIKHAHEPFIVQLLHWAKPYLHPAFEGEAVLSIGKAIDFLKKGTKGIINVMPFTCMPGTITQAIFSRLQKEKGGFPCLHLAFDGQEQTHIQTRLEAFMHQVYNFFALL